MALVDRRFIISVAIAATSAAGLLAQARPPGSGPGQGGKGPGVVPGDMRKVGESVYEIGMMRVDTAKRELTVPGFVNDVTLVEFVANTRNGHKAYESAFTIDANAIRFNAALLLLGLDPSRARVPTKHFDPIPPAGDPVDIFVEWGSPARRVRVEEFLFDKRTNQTLPQGPWVYTGSTFISDGSGNRRYLAEVDGVLIGFVHSPAPVIENPRVAGTNAYGNVVLNDKLGARPGTQVRLVIVALPRDGSPK